MLADAVGFIRAVQAIERIAAALIEIHGARAERIIQAAPHAGGKFLEEFVGTTPWVHLDIAGPAWAEHEGPTRDPGGTGYGVRTLVELAHEYALT